MTLLQNSLKEHQTRITKVESASSKINVRGSEQQDQHVENTTLDARTVEQNPPMDVEKMQT
jgi:hypothetical protein